MTSEAYRYTFNPEVPPEDIQATLLLAVLGAEGLHGEAQVHLDEAHCFDPDCHSCVVDASTAVGRDLNRLFVGFLRREFNPDTFRVERLGTKILEPATAV